MAVGRDSILIQFMEGQGVSVQSGDNIDYMEVIRISYLLMMKNKHGTMQVSEEMFQDLNKAINNILCL